MPLSQTSPRSEEMPPGICAVMGVPYRVSDITSATQSVIDRVQEGGGGYACLAGVHGIITAQHRPELKRALQQAWANFPDGEPVAWMMRRLGAGTTRRVAGPDLMPSVIDAGQKLGIRHFLFGSTPEVLADLKRRLQQRFPEAKIVGTLSPPFRPLSDAEEAAIVDQILASDAQIVWVGLGLPKQDEWMCRNTARLEPCLAMGVGAAFDFLSGAKRRAPLWMRRHGLEWMHRMGSEPRRLGGRYLRTNSEFVVRAFVGIIGQWSRSLTGNQLGRRR
jgi:N-acetylglucosaminyldiphosphoundecaprenol N-acetyl-beta-D-mannosaminyltransferase